MTKPTAEPAPSVPASPLVASDEILPAPGPQSEATRIAGLEADLLRLKDQMLRALAEAENVRRRARLDVEEANKYAVGNLARDLLPVADTLRRALDAIPAEARQADPQLERFATGIELTERELAAAFERHGLKRIDPLGEPFDHNLHQAIMQVQDPDRPAGTVVQVLQSGYTLNGRLLRAAMVALAQGGPAQGGPGQAASPRVDTTA